MGLLAVLYSHKKAQSGQAEEGVEIEREGVTSSIVKRKDRHQGFDL